MSTLNPPMLHRLDLACTHIAKTFRKAGYGPYLVGSVQERTSKAGSDVDVRLILKDEHYDSLMSGTPEGFASLLDFALGAYLRELTGLPIDFQVQRMTEANENHQGPRNPLGNRGMTSWKGDARPKHPSLCREKDCLYPLDHEGPHYPEILAAQNERRNRDEGQTDE